MPLGYFSPVPGDDEEKTIISPVQSIAAETAVAEPAFVMNDENPFGDEVVEQGRVDPDQNLFGDTPVEDEESTATGAALGARRGVNDVLGIPTDITNLLFNSYDYGLASLTGSKPIREAGVFNLDESGGQQISRTLTQRLYHPDVTDARLNALPPDAKTAARFGRIFTAGTTTALIPLVKAAQALTAKQILAQQISMTKGNTGAVRAVGENIMATARRNPGQFLTADVIASAGAAQGDFLARIYHPDSEIAGTYGQVAGGIVNPVGFIYSMARNAGGKVFSAGRALVTPAGREQQAADHLAKILIKAGEDPAAVRRMLEEVPAEFAGIPQLTTGLTSGSPALLHLENTLVQRSQNFADFKADAVDDTFKFLRKQIDQLSNSKDPRAVKIAAEMRITYFDELLAGRIAVAQNEASEALSRIPTTATKSEASAAVHTATKTALREARDVESAFWEAIPRGTIVPDTSNTLNKFQKVASQLTRDDKMPFAKTFADILNPTTQTSAGQMITLRSRLLGEARDLRGANQYNAARRLDELADGILADISKLELPVAKEARDFSRMLNDVFSRTFAGKVLRVDDAGADRISPELLLERAFGGGGTAANVRFRELSEAGEFGDLARNANAQIQNTGIPIGQALGADVLTAQERFIGTMAQATVKDGVVDPQKLAVFMNKNTELLDRFPELKNALADAGSATKAYKQVIKDSERASKAMISRTAFSKVTGSENGEIVIKSIMNGPNPETEFGQLMRMVNTTVKRTGSHAATEGARHATLDWAKTKATGPSGLDFRQLRAALYDPISANRKSVMSMLRTNNAMTGVQAGNLEKVLARGIEIQDAMSTGRGLDELMGEPDAMFDLMIRLAGARAGTDIGGAIGGQTLVVAGATSKAARNAFEKVPAARITAIIDEAMRNPKFAALLLKKARPPSDQGLLSKIGGFGKSLLTQDQINTQINGFLIGAGIIDKETDK